MADLMLAWIRNFIARLWPRKAGAAPAAPAVKRRPRQQKEHYGAHYYLGDLLDHADDAFEHMALLKRGHRDMYDLIHRIGVSVCSSDTLFPKEVEPFIQSALPGFGCVYMSKQKVEDDRIVASFIGFTKQARPINVQVAAGTTYEVVCTYNLEGRAFCGQFYVSLNAGTVTALKECRPTFQSFGNGNGVTRMQWRYPAVLSDIAKETGETVEEIAHGIFSFAAHAAIQPESGLTVRLVKGANSIKFAIDPLRTPYFFRDRDRVVNHNGQTKRILHIVRTHERSGKIVKSHWRGLREFDWNGYAVKIGMGGKHMANASAFDLAVADPTTNEKVVDATHVGRALAKIVDREAI